MPWARTSQKCWGSSIRITHAFRLSEIKSLCNNFSITFFFLPPNSSNPSNGLWTTFLVLCLPSMHITPTIPPVTRSDYILFTNKKQNRKGEEGKKRIGRQKQRKQRNPPHNKLTKPNPFPFFVFFFSRPQKWANQTQRIKTKITKRRKPERLEWDGRTNKKPNTNNPK